VTLLTTVPVGKQPGQVVVNPSLHQAYVVNQKSNSVTVLDTEKLTVKKVIPVGNAPAGIAINPPINMAYVANTGSGSITPINNIQALANWVVGGTPSAVTVDSVLNQLYVMDTSRKQIIVLNATNGTQLASLPTTLQPVAMALNIASHALFVACTGSSGSLVVIDGTHNQITKTVTVAAGTTSISVDPDTNVVVLVSPTANLHTVVNVANGYTVRTQAGDAGAKPYATAYTAGLFLQPDNGDGNIFFSDGSGLITFGSAYQVELFGATGIAVNTSSNQMAVLYGTTDGVYVIELLNPLFPEYYHLETAGLFVAGAAFDPITTRLFVTNNTDNTVSVFDTTPRVMVDAYEGAFDNFGTNYDYVEANPATGTIYTLRMSDLFAINEGAAGAGWDGTSKNAKGVTTIPLADPYSLSLAVNSATNKIYAGDDIGNFYVVDGATNVASKITSVPTTASIESLAVDYATNRILAWDSASSNLYVLDGTTNALLKTVPLTFAEQAFTQVDAGRNLAYVAVSVSVYVVDPATGSIVTTVKLPSTALGAVLNAASNRLYLITSHDVIAIDTSTNTIVSDVVVPYVLQSVAVNTASGNYYAGMNDGNTGTPHVYEYNGNTNTQIADFSRDVYPALTGAMSLTVNPLTSTVYVGSDRPNSSAIAALIDERTGALSPIAEVWDSAAAVFAVDLGSGLVAAPGYDYTNLFFPTSSPTGVTNEPITVSGKGVADSQTIAIKPIFRTRNTKPAFTISATSKFVSSSADLVPKHGFYQVDGWQGTWKAVALTAKPGNRTSSAKVQLSTLPTGRHILYMFASDGDVATIQAGLASGNSVGNSPVISPIASVVFTVEK
jgi:YVTN family beta-propeller protein